MDCVLPASVREIAVAQGVFAIRSGGWLMRQRDKFEIPVEMAKVRRDIEEWRSTRTKRCRLPDWLWEAAATFWADAWHLPNGPSPAREL